MTLQTTERFIRLPCDLYDQVVDLAKREDRSIASAARVLVREALQHRKATATVRDGLKLRGAAHG
jgi:hypothetical protein